MGHPNGAGSSQPKISGHHRESKMTKGTLHRPFEGVFSPGATWREGALSSALFSLIAHMHITVIIQAMRNWKQLEIGHSTGRCC